MAIFAVVTVHVATQNWDKIAAGTGENVVLAVFDAVARFAVPIFVMISGVLRFRWTAYPMFYLMGFVIGSGSWIKSKKKKKVAIVGSVLLFVTSVVGVVVLNMRASITEGAAVHPVDADWSILVIMQAVAMFIGAKLLVGERAKKPRTQKIYTQLAGDVLGVYMVHVALLGVLNSIGVSDVMLSGDDLRNGDNNCTDDRGKYRHS